MDDRYDYIIVGAGSSGCAIASRLTEDPSVRVLLLDAGPDPYAGEVTSEEQSWIEKPELFQFMQTSRLDAQYWTEPQGELDGRSIFTPRGRVIGGTSTFIAGLFVRGNPHDYDGWAAAGNPGWRFEDLLPLFVKCERNRRPGINPAVHGTSGPLTVSDPPPISAATAAFVEACRRFGYPENTDFNSGCQEGAGRYQLYLDERGIRINAANGYLSEDVRRRPNLQIRSGAVAQEILIDTAGRTQAATGVRYIDTKTIDRREASVSADREVIVSCGAFDSPKLLMLSGIGPERELARHGLKVRCHRAGVGQNLQDHIVVPIGYLYRNEARPASFGASGIDGGLFTRTSRSSKRPDLQFVFNHAILGPPAAILPFGFQLVPVLLHPRSRGSVGLRSAAPYGPPVVSGHYLSDSRDRDLLHAAVRRTLEILWSAPFDPLRGDRIPQAPAPGAHPTDREIDAYIRQNGTTLFHPAGTCKMGPASDPLAVVDAELRVHGVARLRVADASIIPTMPSGNVHTPTVMIGEKAADLVRRQVMYDPRSHAAVPGPVDLGALSSADEQRGLATVNRALKSAAYFTVFSMPDAARPNIPIPHPQNPGALIGVEVHEELHRLDVTANRPIGRGMDARKRVGEHIANVGIHWMVIPDDFEAAPGRVPPPTILDPRQSQRFAMLDGQMTFRDRAGSGFRAFGTGRTFPTMTSTGPQLQIGAVIDILEGLGAFAGLPGTIAVNGYITPPDGLALTFILRFADARGALKLTGGRQPLREIADPDPNTVVVTLLGEVNPTRPTTLNTDASGRMTGASVHEVLRLVHIESQALSAPRALLREGPIVGTLSGTLRFDPTNVSPVVPIQTTDGVFSFFGRRGEVVGTIDANIAEGRGFRMPVKGAPLPVFRFGGFGPILRATGDFANVTGLMSLNGAISVFPRTLSNLYVLRLNDPEGRFHAACTRPARYAAV
jgi:choline dehydrogenase